MVTSHPRNRIGRAQASGRQDVPPWRSRGIIEVGWEEKIDWQDYIAVDPNVCHGRACISGTRVLISVVLDNLADGLTPNEIVRAYPSVTVEAVRAAIAFAADLTRERQVAMPA